MPRKTKPRIRRRATAAYVDELVDNKSAICHVCFENNIETILVTYPKDPTHFLQCPYCHVVVDKRRSKHKSVIGPLGSVEGISNPTFTVVESRRRSIMSSNQRSGTGEESFNPSEYPMTSDGQPDSDLAYYSSIGQVTRIIDDDVGEQEFD